MTLKTKRVVIAMSGGVDSSVAAALLKQQGYDVVGMMLRLWSEPGSEIYNRCCTPDSMALARRVAAKLDIPFYVIDAKDVFRSVVVKYFIDGYANNLTPNPCLVCNRYVRWEFLLNRALGIGADLLATGHYARLRKQDGQIQLLRALDQDKDQSYVLHVLGQEQLRHAIFPLGEHTKDAVRQIARDFELPVAERTESQDLCFLGGSDYRDFLKRHAPQISQPGPILNQLGQQIGSHQGLAHYTIGQRKGLGISAVEAFYVLSKDHVRNALIVGTAQELGARRFNTERVNWIADSPPGASFNAMVKIRYKAREVPATIQVQPDGTAQVCLEMALRDITPGQAAVFYQGDLCLGGGTIKL